MNLNDVPISGVAPAADYQKVTTVMETSMTSGEVTQLSAPAKTKILTGLSDTMADKLDVPRSSVTARFSTGEAVGGRRRLSGTDKRRLSGGVQVVFEVTVAAAEAEAVVAAVATQLPDAAAAAAIFLPAIAKVVAALPASEGGAFAVALAATLEISADIATAAPVDFVTESYNKKEVRRLNKKCKNKKSWCDSVTLSGTKSKCQAFCKDGKCTAARKVKKSCKARCKKRCRAFVLSPYHVSDR
jgi:hypothetical protein